jgi:hypothetical protein
MTGMCPDTWLQIDVLNNETSKGRIAELLLDGQFV